MEIILADHASREGLSIHDVVQKWLWKLVYIENDIARRKATDIKPKKLGTL